MMLFCCRKVPERSKVMDLGIELTKALTANNNKYPLPGGGTPIQKGRRCSAYLLGAKQKNSFGAFKGVTTQKNNPWRCGGTY